jgi:hypothetical protein
MDLKRKELKDLMQKACIPFLQTCGETRIK